MPKHDPSTVGALVRARDELQARGLTARARELDAQLRQLAAAGRPASRRVERRSTR